MEAVFCSATNVLINILRWRRNGCHFAGSIFRLVFFNDNCYILLECHWNLFPTVQLVIHQYCLRWWLVFEQATIHYPNQWWPILLTHICATRQWIKLLHDDVIKWKHFPRYWPFVRGIHRSPVNSTHKGQWRGALMLHLICVWTNAWVNNRDAGDLRRFRVHYDVTVMWPTSVDRVIRPCASWHGRWW